MSKTIKTRLQQKTDTSTNWAKATAFVPLKGEVIVYSDLNKTKIGDGTTAVNSLPFTNANVASYAEACTKAANDSDGNQITATYLPKSKVVSKGSATNPVYFDSTGEAKPTTYSLNKTVPSDAVFSDTKNTAGATANNASILYLIGAAAQTTSPQTYTNGIYTKANGLYTYNIFPTIDNMFSLGDSSHRWTVGHFSRLYADSVYVTNVVSDSDLKDSLRLSAGNTITFEYSGYTGAQSYIDVPHGKGTSSSHDVLACKSDLSSLANEDELPEMVTSISADYSYNDNVEITEIYLQFEMMDDAQIENPLVLMGTSSSFASSVSVYYNYMGVKTAATLQGSTLPSGNLQLYEVNLTRNASNNTVSFVSIPTNDPARLKFNKKYNGSDVVYFYGSNSRGWWAVTDSDIANLSLYSKKTHKHAFTGTSKAVSVSGQYSKATGVSINPITPSGSISLTAGTAPSLSSSSSSSTGAIPFISSVSGGSATGTTKYFHPSFTGSSGSISASYTPSGSVSLTRSQDVALSSSSVNSMASAGSGSLTSDTTASGGIKYVESIGNDPAVGTSEYLVFSAGTTPVSSASFSGTAGTATGSFTPSGSVSLTRSVDVALNTSSINAISSVGSGSLASTDTASTGDISYVSDISSTGASASGTGTFVKTISGGSGSLTSDTTASGGISYVSAISSTGASASGTGTFLTSINGGSGSLTSNSTSTDGISYLKGVSYIPSLTRKYMEFSKGSLPSFSAVSNVRTGGSTSTGVSITGTVTNGVLELSAATSSAYLTGTSTTSINSMSNAGSLPSLDFVSASMSGQSFLVDYTGALVPSYEYLHHTHTGASAGNTGTAVTGVTGGVTSATTKYLHHTHTGASAGSTGSAVTGVTGGTVSATKKYLHHVHTAPTSSSATVATSVKTQPSFTGSFTGSSGSVSASYIPSGSVSLTRGTAPSLVSNQTSSTGSISYVKAVDGGVPSVTTKYLHHTHTSPSSSSVTVATGVSKQPTFTGSFTGSAGTATGSFTPSGSVSLGSTATASGGVAYTESVSSTGASGSTSYLKLNAGTTPPQSASFTGTSVTPTGTISSSNVSLASTGTYTPEGTLSSATE